MYGGASLFILHVLRNKLMVTKRTPIFAVAPYFLWLGFRYGATKWIDFEMEERGVYEKYEIYDV